MVSDTNEITNKIKEMTHEFLYLKTKLMFDSENNMDSVLTSSEQPGMLEFIALNMLSSEMQQEITNKERIIEIILLIHIFINILCKYYIKHSNGGLK